MELTLFFGQTLLNFGPMRQITLLTQFLSDLSLRRWKLKTQFLQPASGFQISCSHSLPYLENISVGVWNQQITIVWFSVKSSLDKVSSTAAPFLTQKQKKKKNLFLLLSLQQNISVTIWLPAIVQEERTICRQNNLLSSICFPSSSFQPDTASSAPLWKTYILRQIQKVLYHSLIYPCWIWSGHAASCLHLY